MLAIGHTTGIEFDRYYHNNTDTYVPITCQTDIVWISIKPILKYENDIYFGPSDLKNLLPLLYN